MSGSVLRSIDLHLDYPPGEVVRVDELVDVGAGIYPVYYYVRDGEVLASTSVTELIFELGSFERHAEFTPPNYFECAGETTPLEKFYTSLPDVVKFSVPSSVRMNLKERGLIDVGSEWSETSNTVDARISVLQAFERVTPDGRTRDFEPTYSLSDPTEFVERSAAELQEFVHSIERRFPDHEHVVRVGGRDSQLITLIPKLTDNWHVFSAEPSHWIVDRFLFENDIEVGEFFHHDNENEETWRDFRRKLICGDIRADPRHQRWYPTLDEIAARFDRDCIFWIGTEGDTINTYFPDFHEAEDYFAGHFSRAANWQGVTHQLTKNFTGAPALSPYHSESIWTNVYRHYDPDMISESMDLRPRIAEQWYDRDIWWPDRNPAPAPYEYTFEDDYRDVYFDYISDCLDGDAESVIG